MRLTVASLYTLPLVVLKSSESASDVNRTAKIKVPQYFTRRILPFFVSTRQRQNDTNGARVTSSAVCHAVKLTLEFFVATALRAVNESIEMSFFRGLDEHFFALQTIFGVLHVRCGNVCLKTRFIPPFHVQ